MMLVRYQELKGIELYAYQVGEDLYPYTLYDDDGFSETQEFNEASKHMHKWNKVIQAAVFWVKKPIAIACKVANTVEEKRKGLQETPELSPGEGMYFPYNPTADVTFHQGSVTYPLDILFIRNDQVVHIESKTKIGSKDTWSCPCCDGVLEVIGGFCEVANIRVGDELALFGLTAQDLEEYKEQQIDEAVEAGPDDETHVPDYSLNLHSSIASNFLGF